MSFWKPETHLHFSRLGPEFGVMLMACTHAHDGKGLDLCPLAFLQGQAETGISFSSDLLCLPPSWPRGPARLLHCEFTSQSQVQLEHEELPV